MNKYAKIVLWLGLIMILAQFVRAWPIIHASLFRSSGSSGYFTNPVNGKCPPGHQTGMIGGKKTCVPVLQPGPPPAF